MSTTYDAPKGFDTVLEGVTYSAVQEITYESKTTGTVRKANLLLPVNYDETKQYPVGVDSVQ